MTIVTASKSFAMFGITDSGDARAAIFRMGQHQWDIPRFAIDGDVLQDNKPIESFDDRDDFPGLGRRVFSLKRKGV